MSSLSARRAGAVPPLTGALLALGLGPLTLQGQVSGGAGSDLTAADRAALEQLGEAHAVTFELVDSWFAGRPIQYYDFGRDAARPTILYRVRGGSDVVTTLTISFAGGSRVSSGPAPSSTRPSFPRAAGWSATPPSGWSAAHGTKGPASPITTWGRYRAFPSR